MKPFVSASFTLLRKPVSVLISIPLLVVLTGGWLAWNGERGMKRVLGVMAMARLADQNQAAANLLHNAFQRTQTMVQRLGRLDGLLEQKNPDQVAEQLLLQLEAVPLAVWVHLSDGQGRFVGLKREGDGVVLLDRRSPAQGRQVWRVQPDGRCVLDVEQPGYAYDPRTRPYYTSAAAAPGVPTWIDPYIFQASQKPGIACAYQPAASATAGLVAAVEYDIEALSALVALIDDQGTQARMILSTTGGVLVAAASANGPERVTRGDGSLPRLAEQADPVLAGLWRSLDERRAAKRAEGEWDFPVINADGAQVRWSVHTQAVPVGSTVWFAARMLPHSEITAPAQGTIATGRVVAATAVSAALIMALLYALALTRAERQIRSARAEADAARADAQAVGSYRLVRRLGAGGMGEVWLAKHHFLARPAAVKFLHPGVAGPEATTRFEREARAISRMRSRNTITIYDYGVGEDGRCFYVMELLDGMDLDQVVRRFGPIPPARAARILRQACLSLAEAHDQGLVHRDIKPGNIFLCRLADETDVVKVLDFGLVAPSEAGREPRLTQEGMVNGTPEFMAPEQARGMPLDGRADIYALGCVAYWLLTGQVPYDDPNPMSILIKHLEAPIPDVRSVASAQPIGEDFADIIARCMAKEPEQRPAGVRDLAEALAALRPVAGERPWGAPERRGWWQEIPRDLPDLDAGLGTAAVIAKRR